MAQPLPVHVAGPIDQLFVQSRFCGNLRRCTYGLVNAVYIFESRERGFNAIAQLSVADGGNKGAKRRFGPGPAISAAVQTTRADAEYAGMPGPPVGAGFRFIVDITSRLRVDPPPPAGCMKPHVTLFTEFHPPRALTRRDAGLACAAAPPLATGRQTTNVAALPAAVSVARFTSIDMLAARFLKGARNLLPHYINRMVLRYEQQLFARTMNGLFHLYLEAMCGAYNTINLPGGAVAYAVPPADFKAMTVILERLMGPKRVLGIRGGVHGNAVPYTTGTMVNDVVARQNRTCSIPLRYLRDYYGPPKALAGGPAVLQSRANFKQKDWNLATSVAGPAGALTPDGFGHAGGGAAPATTMNLLVDINFRQMSPVMKRFIRGALGEWYDDRLGNTLQDVTARTMFTHSNRARIMLQAWATSAVSDGPCIFDGCYAGHALEITN